MNHIKNRFEGLRHTERFARATTRDIRELTVINYSSFELREFPHIKLKFKTIRWKLNFQHVARFQPNTHTFRSWHFHSRIDNEAVERQLMLTINVYKRTRT